ncbi:MAG: hypothetical protein PHX59_09465 [Sulfuricurvum sp.]|nr:hypothetical protein [Sulfuricurvum sp.]
MQPNVIYLSDASFDSATCSAGIGVKNLFSGESMSLGIQAEGINEAEEIALLCAIEHAYTHGHRNCVFVYDNLNIDTKILKGFYGAMFEKIQFMWFKREYLGEVDRLAAMVRSKTVKMPHLDLLKRHIPGLNDQILVTMFMPMVRGDTYGFLCTISQTAPLYKELPKRMSNANKTVLALLCQMGSSTLRTILFERFGVHKALKHTV